MNTKEPNAMKQSRLINYSVFAVTVLAIAAFCACGNGSAKRPPSQAAASAQQPAGPPQQLSADAQTQLRTAVQAGNLPELRWPNFSDYTKLVQKFYDLYGYSLPWVRDMQPTPQAQQVIALF